MGKFKEGDYVTLVKHSSDSEENLRIGAVGTVLQSGLTRNKILWESPKRYRNWWVDDVSLELHNPSLENE